MAGSLNKVLLIGNVGKDPEIRTTQDGKEIASLVLATSDTWRDKSTGDKRERTEWHRIVIFSEGLVNVVKTYVKKGAKLFIEGSLQTRKWSDNAGTERYTTEIVLQGYNCSLTMLDARQGSGSEAGGHSDNGKNKEKDSSSDFLMDDLDDEIPF
jgi:single-strand DNA-binding protein